MSAIAKYLATQIKEGKLDYTKVTTKFPQYVDDIDAQLREYGILGKFKK